MDPKRPPYTWCVAVGACLGIVAAQPLAQESPILSAMQDELKRSMADLRMKDQPAPYYIDYEIVDTASTRLLARLGALVDDSSGRTRTLQVDVRVGDYAFDSSRFITLDRSAGVVPTGETTVSLDDDYDALRRQIWLVTDATYKRAVNVFAKKKAAFQNRAGTEALPDLSRETPAQTVLPAIAPTRAGRDWIDRVQLISAVFAASPSIYGSDVSIVETRGTRYYVSSEGAKVVAPIQSASLRVVADTQADDGMVLRDFFIVVENSLQEMPPAGELVARARDLASTLTSARTLKVGEEFTGPILIEGQASAELIAQTLVPLTLARRPPDSDNPRMAQAALSQVTPFLSRIGSRVLPDSFSASDTPSMKEFNGRRAPGAYVVDDEGVVAKDVTLVENGKLVTLLIGRTPMKNLLQSNGRTRGTVQASVFQLRSAQATPAAALKQKYLDLLNAQDKPFGYIVRAIANPTAVQVSAADAGGPVILRAVKVTRDGREEPVRGIRFANIAPAAFRNLLEASEERMLYSYRSGSAAVSVIVPDLIFEELEVQKSKDILQKPPTVPSPLR